MDAQQRATRATTTHRQVGAVGAREAIDGRADEDEGDRGLVGGVEGQEHCKDVDDL